MALRVLRGEAVKALQFEDIGTHIGRPIHVPKNQGLFVLRRGRRDSRGREGQALVELAILLTLMAIVLVVALTFLGQSTSSSVGRVSEAFGRAGGDSGLVSQPGGRGNPGGGSPGKGVGNGGNPGKPPNPGHPPQL